MITRNFAREEFACRCGCGLAEPHPMLVIGLQRLRGMLSVPITITSGCRCHAHNQAVGGAPGSFHLPRPDLDGYCCAADITASPAALFEVPGLARLTEAFGPGGIGVYAGATSWIHLDVRAAAGGVPSARWAMINGQPARFDEAVAQLANDRRS